MQTAPFIAKLLEAEPRELMESKLTGSRKAARKQKVSEEIGPPRTVAFIMEGPWSALARHSSILLSFHKYSDLEVSAESQNIVIYGQIWSRMVQKPAKHIKEPY